MYNVLNIRFSKKSMTYRHTYRQGDSKGSSAPKKVYTGDPIKSSIQLNKRFQACLTLKKTARNTGMLG